MFIIVIIIWKKTNSQSELTYVDSRKRKTIRPKKRIEIYLSPMTNVPIPTKIINKASGGTKTLPKIEYTRIADRLRTISWSNYSHPT